MSSAAWPCCNITGPANSDEAVAGGGPMVAISETANGGAVFAIRTSDDVVRVRQEVRARAVAAGLGIVDQTKIVTAASEIARNTLDYGGGGTVTMYPLADGMRRGLRMVFEDQGPGIADIAQALRD